MKLAINPQRQARVCNIQAIYGTRRSDDVAVVYFPRDRFDRLFRNEMPTLLGQAQLCVADEFHLSGVGELPVRFSVGRHELDGLTIEHATEISSDVQHEAFPLSIADPIGEVMEAARIPFDGPVTVAQLGENDLVFVFQCRPRLDSRPRISLQELRYGEDIFDEGHTVEPLEVDNQPLGAFDFAYVGIACRTGIKPRHLVMSSFCSSPSAAEFMRKRYGFACQLANVSCRETYDRVRGVVTVDERSVLDVSITDCVPLLGAGATIKYSPALNAVKLGDAGTLVQFEAAYEFKRVLRGKPRAVTFESTALGDVTLTPTHAIAGSHAVMDLHLMPMRFSVDLETPAEAGGARKIAR